MGLIIGVVGIFAAFTVPFGWWVWWQGRELEKDTLAFWERQRKLDRDDIDGWYEREQVSKETWEQKGVGVVEGQEDKGTAEERSRDGR